MGVLDARKDAEKVGFPVVGEEGKDASNVIDYDIHKEQTKDTAAIINANNQTTTGMATVIPGVNAPKLIAKTSIVGSLGAEGGVGGVNISGGARLSHPDGTSATIRNWSKSGERGDLDFTIIPDQGFKVPETGWYELVINYPTGRSNNYIVTDIRYIRGGGASQGLIYHTGQASTTQETETKKLELSKGDIIYAVLTMHYIGTSYSYSTDVSMSIRVTKL